MTMLSEQQQAKQEQAYNFAASLTGEGSQSVAVTTPKFPLDPLLDVDYIVDAENYLEDYIHAYDLPAQTAVKYTTSISTTMTTTTTTTTTTMTRTATTTTTTETTTTTIETTTISAAETTTTTTPTTTAITATMTTMTTTTTTTATTANIASLSLVTCYTRADPRIERHLQFLYRSRPAPQGTLCKFGVTPKDEGSHCVLDGGKYGSFGWCYTKDDRSEWGSCGEGCPLEGSSEVLAARIDLLTLRVQAALEKLGASECIDLKNMDNITKT